MLCATTLQWHHNGRAGVSNDQPHDCIFNRLFRCRSKKTSKLRVTGICVGNSPVTGEFPAQMASNAENVSIWWHHHGNTTRKFPVWHVQPLSFAVSFVSAFFCKNIYTYFHTECYFVVYKQWNTGAHTSSKISCSFAFINVYILNDSYRCSLCHFLFITLIFKVHFNV